jgi:pimeloyl-ACP methyl ester carboxylesterase
MTAECPNGGGGGFFRREIFPPGAVKDLKLKVKDAAERERSGEIAEESNGITEGYLGITEGYIGIAEGYIDAMGLRVHYLRAGAGAPLVLLHGLVGSVATWRKNIAALAEDATVYAIDMVNMGKSQCVPGLDASLVATADRVAACMDALGLARADIAAHSHGGAVALTLAARHPGRVSRLILFAPANPFCNAGRNLIRFYSSALGRVLAKCVPYLPRPVYWVAVGRMYGDFARVQKEAITAYQEEMRSPGAVAHILEIVRRWYPDMAGLRGELEGIAIPKIPTLLLWGDRDRAVTVASGRKLRRVLPQAELVVLPGAGHLLFEEMPEECNRLVKNWLGPDAKDLTPMNADRGTDTNVHSVLSYSAV